MGDYHNKRAKEILSTVLYATVATASKYGKPWNSPVAGFWDKQLNLYWFSDKDSVHSNNIRENKDVFIVVYDTTMKEGAGEGVYIEATAYEVIVPDEVRQVVGLQTGDMRCSYEQVTGDAVHRFYKATPKNIWMNDDEKDDNGKYVRDIRVEVPLEQIV
jgi:bifunctional DNA-binding transcriptional regulator/antitoxin component of YhaV-PrlF toxin-antitoxin module